MVDRLILRLKLWSRSRYVMAARYVMSSIGLKYVRMLIYERSLDTEIPKVETKVPVEVRLVSAEDVKSGRYEGVSLASGDDPSRHDEMLRRLSNGEICHTAIVGDEVAGFAWLYMQKTKYEADIEREESFDEDEVLFYDALVFPKFQGNRIGKKLTEQRSLFLKFKNYRKARAYVAADNVVERKSIEAVGFDPTRIITCFRVFWFKRIKERPINR